MRRMRTGGDGWVKEDIDNKDEYRGRRMRKEWDGSVQKEMDKKADYRRRRMRRMSKGCDG